MEINYALIGKRIRETRKQRGLSAEELAELADLSTVYISYIENACISSSVFPKNRKEKFPTLGMGYSHISAGNIFI